MSLCPHHGIFILFLWWFFQLRWFFEWHDHLYHVLWVHILLRHILIGEHHSFEVVFHFSHDLGHVSTQFLQPNFELHYNVACGTKKLLGESGIWYQSSNLLQYPVSSKIWYYWEMGVRNQGDRYTFWYLGTTYFHLQQWKHSNQECRLKMNRPLPVLTLHWTLVKNCATSPTASVGSGI